MRIVIDLAVSCEHYRRMLIGICGWGHRYGVETVQLLSRRYRPMADQLAPGDALVAGCFDEAAVEALAALPVPVVVVTGRVAPRLPAVLPDPRAAGVLSARHLIDLGVRRLVWVHQDLWIARQRWSGFEAEALRAGIDVGAVDPDRAVASLAGMPGPVGVGCASDQFARSVVRKLVSAGIPVPGRCAVIGTDDDHLMVLTSPVALSSVDIDSVQVGWRAAQLAADLAAGRPAPGAPILVPPAGVLVRASTDLLAVADPWMAKAVRALRAGACAGGTVADLLRGIPVSRRMVERFYRDTFARSPAEELEALRLAEARRLLATTRIPVAAVAKASGYASDRAFIRAFGRRHGCTPGRFREVRDGLPAIR